MNQNNNEKIIEIVRHSIKYGSFALSSGQLKPWICDIFEVREYFKFLVEQLNPRYPLVGIELGGVLLASVYSNGVSGIIRKDGSFYKPLDLNSGNIVSLLDDAVTTERTMLRSEKVLNDYNIIVGERLVILDRRKDKITVIKSLVTVYMLDLSED